MVRHARNRIIGQSYAHATRVMYRCIKQKQKKALVTRTSCPIIINLIVHQATSGDTRKGVGEKFACLLARATAISCSMYTWGALRLNNLRPMKRFALGSLPLSLSRSKTSAVSNEKIVAASASRNS